MFRLLWASTSNARSRAPELAPCQGQDMKSEWMHKGGGPEGAATLLQFSRIVIPSGHPIKQRLIIPLVWQVAGLHVMPYLLWEGAIADGSWVLLQQTDLLQTCDIQDMALEASSWMKRKYWGRISRVCTRKSGRMHRVKNFGQALETLERLVFLVLTFTTRRRGSQQSSTRLRSADFGLTSLSLLLHLECE